MHKALYEVWFSKGTGLTRGPGFRLLQDARHYVQQHEGEGVFAVRGPDGHWHTWGRRPPDYFTP